MFTPDFEHRILNEAKAKGLLRDEPVAEGAAPGQGPSWVVDSPSFWGINLASAVSRGRLSPKDLDGLAWEVVSQEAGSWVDPLFVGPAPLGDLSGFGDRYRDLVLVGEGATAQVFKALDTLLQRTVALKVLKNAARSTLAEARAQAKVEHPNICRIYEVGQGYIVMQLVEGPTLARLAPSLSLRQKLELVRDIACGVHAAHLKGLIHLDLKLTNILVQNTTEGNLVPVVGDFGMMQAPSPEAAGGCPMGTPPYTSPEQLLGNPSHLSPKSDVYAMGVMLYILVAGVIPFRAKDFQGLLSCMAQEAPVSLHLRVSNLPNDLVALVHRCLEKVPEARYPSALELARDLDRFLAGEPVAAMKPSWWYRIGKWTRRNRRLAWTSVLSLALLSLGAGLWITNTRYVYEQAEWDHHFQMLVEDARLRLDHAYRLPAHDIEPELEGVRGIQKTVEGEMTSQGRSALGPGHLALGQLKLLLEPRAKSSSAHFQKAWDSGFQTEGARTWLAYSMLMNYRNTKSELSVMRPGEPALDPRTAQERYLEAARRMLQGRRNPDKIRVASLADAIQLSASGSTDSAARLAFVRAYRSQHPEDLQGLLDEADALRSLAFDIWNKVFRATPAWPPPCAKEVDPLRDETERRLLEALRIAPSHPEIYFGLASMCLDRERNPTETHQEDGAYLDQARAWLEQGQRITPRSHHLDILWVDYLGEVGPQHRLRQGLDLAPQERVLLGRFQRSWATRGAEVFDYGLFGISIYVNTCAWFGRPFEPAAQEVLRIMARQPWADSGKDVNAESLTSGLVPIAQALLAAGGDPTPLLQAFPGDGNSAPTREAGWASFERLLLRAEYQLLRGGEAAPLLREAEQSLLNHREAAFGTSFELRLRLLQAQAIDTPGAWAECETCLDRVGAASTQNPLAPRGDLIARARLGLARHLQQQGREVGTLLRATRVDLQAESAKRFGGDLLFSEDLAELCLLEAKAGGQASAILSRGLAHLEPILHATWSPGRESAFQRLRRIYLRNGDITRGGPPRWGRIHMLRGELLLAMAEAGARAERRPLALQARQAFRESLNCNGNLQRTLVPLQNRAKDLARLGPQD